uniref:Uncharacterized protein n=1 Tax=Rhizophora mucronata TaxID=61149 RepID=A0A2P2QF76_RHIMU
MGRRVENLSHGLQ